MLFVFLGRLLLFAAVAGLLGYIFKVCFDAFQKARRRKQIEAANEAKVMKKYYEDMGSDEMSSVELVEYEELCRTHGFRNKLKE